MPTAFMSAHISPTVGFRNPSARLHAPQVKKEEDEKKAKDAPPPPVDAEAAEEEDDEYEDKEEPSGMGSIKIPKEEEESGHDEL